MRVFPGGVDLQKVEIHVTEVCNNRCTFCTTGWNNLEKGDSLVHVPREAIRAQLEDAYQRGARRALFQGGEPTVRRDLGELLADARAIGYQATTIFTNARMAASRAGAAWLVGMNVTWWQVSIQGGTAAAHDASVAAEGAFDQTLAGAKRLVSLGQRVKINAVLTRHLLDSLAEFAERMIELRPEEVGLDTIKPSGAFGPSRESYAALAPPFSGYSAAIRDAMLRMDRAGLLARLTSFPPCLVPGAEHLVSEEATSTLTVDSRGRSLEKHLWKRSMQVKAPACASCAHDAVCGGVYEPYAQANGLDELRPLASRVVSAPVPSEPGTDVALTRALRALFVRPEGAPAFGVRSVRRLSSGAHELDCYGPGGDVLVTLAPPGEAPAFASTRRFAVGYRNPTAGAADTRIVDAVVRLLRRVEASLPADERAAPPHGA